MRAAGLLWSRLPRFGRLLLRASKHLSKHLMIRAAKTADTAQIAQMIRAMCSEIENMGGHEVSSDEDLWSNLPNKVIEWLQATEQRLIVAESPQKSLVGFGDCRSYLLGAAFKPRKLLHIGSLYVTPNHRNRGLGKSLIDAMLDWAKEQGCEACELNVHINNPAARFYEKLGFDRFQTQMKIELV